MGLVFGWCLIGIFVVLIPIEVARFRRARVDADEVPYPPRRLRRRIISAVLLMAVVALVTYWPAPQAGWKLHAGLLLLVLIMMLAAFVLWWRDLAETSRAVVEHAGRLDPPQT